MATSRVTIDQPLFVCPACKKPVSGRMAYKIDLSPQGGVDQKPDQIPGETPAIATAIGLQVSHDCAPATTRSRGDQPRILRPEE